MYTTRNLASGKTAILDPSKRVVLVGTPDEADQFLDEYDYYSTVCECEVDWVCPMHKAASR